MYVSHLLYFWSFGRYNEIFRRKKNNKKARNKFLFWLREYVYMYLIRSWGFIDWKGFGTNHYTARKLANNKCLFMDIL